MSQDPKPRQASAPTPSSPVTELLLEWRDGDHGALDRLTPIVYDELRRLAHGQMRREGGGGTLQTTALVHEAYLRLSGQDIDWESRDHFFAIAATVMRRVLVDDARRRRSRKRGGEAEQVPLAELGQEPGMPGPDADILALDAALEQLSANDPRKGRIIELRFFGGLTIAETARVMELSHATVERDYRIAKAWLSQALAS
ncbi:MAG: sigma-70 family RNA polymerase sigma factor [Acidobacteriota bacterium]